MEEYALNYSGSPDYIATISTAVSAKRSADALERIEELLRLLVEQGDKP